MQRLIKIIVAFAVAACLSLTTFAASQLTITDIRESIQENNLDIQIVYPQIDGDNLTEPAQNINSTIQEYVKILKNSATKKRDAGGSAEGVFAYKTARNAGGYVSLVLKDTLNASSLAHPETGQRSITFEAMTKQELTFDQLFVENKDYKNVVNELINDEIAKRALGDKLLEDYKGVCSNTKFYLTDTSVVVYYNPAECFPHSEGIVEFEIPYSQLNGILKPEITSALA